MSYEDLKEARTKRREQKAVREARSGKRSRKPRVSTHKASVPKPWVSTSKALEQARLLAE